MRDRIGDRRVVDLVKAFLKAGILSGDGIERDTLTGCPQGGILSPLLSNIALSVLDEHFDEVWRTMGTTSSQRQQRRRKGLATYRLVRYADLSRVRDKSAYAEDRIMPRFMRSPSVCVGFVLGCSA
jgi:RNA-directed DNA polymerase